MFKDHDFQTVSREKVKKKKRNGMKNRNKIK